jgi:tetratricopeptide (TPR) repeat protein
MQGRSLVLGATLAVTLCSARWAEAQESDVQTARELYEQGASAYSHGNFEAAITAFERAYAISGNAALLFNIAQAERLAGPEHCERALQAYQRFLREDPDASNVAEVEQRIGEMKACSDARRASEQPPAARVARRSSARQETREPAAPAVPPRASSLGPALTLGSGALVAATGAVIYILARVKFDDAASSCPCREGEFAAWERATNVSYGLLAVGGLTMAAGATWWLVDRKQNGSASYAAGFSGGRISVAGSF